VSLLGEALKVRREELGLGQEHVADRLGVSQQTVSRWEKGLALPRPARVVTLAGLLDLDSEHLHRLAGYLPEGERSELAGPFQELYAGMAQLSRTELVLLLDRVVQEMRRREGLSPPGLS
jgi:HTH-type transcriptional regulator, cell division transcriptional repressor